MKRILFLIMIALLPAMLLAQKSGGEVKRPERKSTTQQSSVKKRTSSVQKQKKDDSGLQLTVTAGGVSFQMVKVVGGTFKYGLIEDESTIVDKRGKVEEVTVADFYIGETEVTQELWEAVMGKNPSRFKGLKRPVENVTWYECQDFIKELNRMTQKKFRMPTEEEWEFAARGGNKSGNTKYPGSNIIDKLAWYSGNSGAETHDVKTRQPNELGLYDMSGNVVEWCDSPLSRNDYDYCWHRGGDFTDGSDRCCILYRGYDATNEHQTYVIIGLRLVL